MQKYKASDSLHNQAVSQLAQNKSLTANQRTWVRQNQPMKRDFWTELCAKLGIDDAWNRLEPAAENASQTAQPSTSIVCREHARNDCFVGRETELEKLYKNFFGAPGVKSVAKQAITGLGGVGKTSLALRYAEEYADKYSGPRFFCHAATRKALLDDYAALAAYLEMPEAETTNAQTFVTQYLGSKPGYLAIFDNADFIPSSARDDTRLQVAMAVLAELNAPSGRWLDKILRSPEYQAAKEQMTEAEFARFLPANPAGHILLTTRNDRFVGAVDVSTRVPLNELPPDRAQRFLVERVHGVNTSPEELPAEEQKAVERLARTLFYYPLALEQAAAFIETSGLTFELYLSEYEQAARDNKERWLALVEQGQPRVGHYRASVATTLQISIGAVGRENPASVELLQLSAYIATDTIPITVVVEAANHECPLLREAFAPAVTITDDTERAHAEAKYFAALLTPLSRYSLVQRGADGRSFSVHRVSQMVVRALLGEVKSAKETI